jgi:hypothetical protein
MNAISAFNLCPVFVATSFPRSCRHQWPSQPRRARHYSTLPCGRKEHNEEDWKMRVNCRKGPMEIQRPLMGNQVWRCDGRHTQSAKAQNNLDCSPVRQPLPQSPSLGLRLSPDLHIFHRFYREITRLVRSNSSREITKVYTGALRVLQKRYRPFFRNSRFCR